ncbi:hypothetical protein SLEP1_g21281 [Rubroshorea leprosula]|uniref:Uncharacterized protein n=1 Tax=Rubroshorea leprosula TaxID=152421 RepID=A0AAV5JBJ0_9ROSI|nr:hypothetical protein SLEP1_g21281 [Rubroshorea leprosula]
MRERFRERESARVWTRRPAARDSGNGLRRWLPGFGKQYLGQATSFFFYDFPEDSSAKDLWFCFGSYGKVADVYIPARRDRRGRRFGFVRMSEVSNVTEMERKLNQIWLGSYHLKVKVADSMKKGKEGSMVRHKAQIEKKWIKRDNKVNPKVTYAQVVTGNMAEVEDRNSTANALRHVSALKENESIGKRVVEDGIKSKGSEAEPETRHDGSMKTVSFGRTAMRCLSKPDLVLTFSPTEEEGAWLKRSWGAMVRSLDMVKQIQNRFNVDGVRVTVALLGGCQVVLLDNSEGCLEEFIKDNRELIDYWFEWIQQSSLTTKPLLSRLVWLRLTGVPLKAWSDRCFTELGGLIGEVILVDEDTKSKSFLCEGRVLILSTEKTKVSTIVKLQIDGEDFPVTVEEEEWRMDPDWWLVGERRNPASDSDSEASSDGYNNCQLNEDGFLGDEVADLAEDRAATSLDVHVSLNEQGVLAEKRSGELIREHGLGVNGPGLDNLSGPELVENGLQLAEWGMLEPAGSQLCRRDRVKKYKCVEEIYAGGRGVRESRETEVSWVMERTRLRRERKEAVQMAGSWQEVQREASLSDGCIQQRNHVIRQQMEVDEVRRLFEMGQRLGIQCQQNEAEVFSRMTDLEERDAAPCDKKEKALLWEEMGSLVSDQGGRWLLAGDFNSVRSIIERKGRLGETQDMEEFNRFVEGNGLIDVKLLNRKFTWYRSDGSSMSRLDRFLLSSEMSMLERDWTQVGPFRALDVWQQHPEFRDFVVAKWENLQMEGWAAFKCHKKLQLLKEECKRWNKEVFGNVEVRYESLLQQIEMLDKKSEETDLNENEVMLRRVCSQEVWEILQKREAVWKQKSRANWVRLGDANTAFFHRCVHARQAQNVLSGILGEGGWVEEPDLIKAEAVRYFCQLFQNKQWSRPVMGGIQFRRISAEQREWLERPFSIEEIEEGLHSCDGSKAPGPDGFNFNFIKFAWSSLKDDFVNFMCEFHQHGRLVKGLNSSFLALIPKKLNPLQFKEYRPISLLGCLYKLLAKAVGDSVLILNEVVHEVKSRKQQSFMFKADFEKAYDCVDWGFLDWMMDSMGFGDKWRKWIRECLSTARISVLINGSPTKEFSVSKGLRQDDPLSPFLFLLVGEGLCGLVKKAEGEGLLRGVEIGRGGVVLSLLQFADDTVFIGTADAENVRVVKAILFWFELISGLKIDFSKSHLYGFNISEGWLQGAADMLHCGVGKVPFIYLGLPVGGNPGRKRCWKSIIERFHQKLATWKSPLLSFGGRITLINSRNFFWGGVSLAKKIPWVSWECMCAEKGKGGLGVVDLERKNGALLGKWWFRLGDGLDSLWKRMIWGKYYGGRRERDVTSVECLNMSRIWKDIVCLGSRSERFTKMKEGVLKDMGGWCGDNWVWECRWRCGSRGRAAEEEEIFRAMINGFTLRIDREDVWKWVHSSDGCYSVKAAYEFLTPTSCFVEEKWAKVIWNRYVPSKVSVFGWRLFLNRLATKENLCKRGIVLSGGDKGCVFCHEGEEHLHHIFCGCKRVWLVWMKVLGWWEIQGVLPNDLFSWVELVVFEIGGGVLKELGALMFLVTAWFIWYWRNLYVFRSEGMSEEQLFESIQAKSFSWLKNKEPGCVFSYTDWMLRPRECREAIVQHRKNLKSARNLQSGADWMRADQEG